MDLDARLRLQHPCSTYSFTLSAGGSASRIGGGAASSLGRRCSRSRLRRASFCSFCTFSTWWLSSSFSPAARICAFSIRWWTKKYRSA